MSPMSPMGAPPARSRGPAAGPAGGGPPAAVKKRRKAAEEAGSFGVVISGLSLKSKKDAAVEIIMKIKGVSEAEAEDMCRSPVVPVLKNVSSEEAEEAKDLFKAAKVNVRVTSQRKRR